MPSRIGYLRALLPALFSTAIALMIGCGSDASSNPSHPSAQLKSKDEHHHPSPRPRTKEGCDRCGGLWAIHGIEPVESCICRTSDGGERCFDGRECEGQCLVDRDIASNSRSWTRASRLPVSSPEHALSTTPRWIAISSSRPAPKIIFRCLLVRRPSTLHRLTGPRRSDT